MKEKEEYKTHIIERWRYAIKIAEEDLSINDHNKTHVALAIFEKMCTPFHYFLKDNTIDEPKPTEKQLEYAKKLGIKNLETYSKKTLSEKIKEVLNND